MRVFRRDEESFESLLRRFKAGVARAGIISEFKRHQAFMSKRERDRLKERKATRKRQIKEMRKAA